MPTPRSNSPPPRSPSPDLLPKPLPSPRRRPSNLAPRDPPIRRDSHLRSTRSVGCLNSRNTKFDLRFDEFGSKGNNAARFPQSEHAVSPPRTSLKRRASTVLSPARPRSPPPVIKSRSPPPPLPPIPSFLLSAAHKTKDKGGLQHLYIPDVQFSYSLSMPKSAPSDQTFTRLNFFASMRDRTPPAT